MMSAQLKEALAALDELHEGTNHRPGDRARLVHTIRTALTLALRESTAWDDINAFQRTHGDEYDLIVGLANEESEADGEYLVRLVDVSDGSDAGWFPGASRVECLEAAAGFCREELANE